LSQTTEANQQPLFVIGFPDYNPQHLGLSQKAFLTPYSCAVKIEFGPLCNNPTRVPQHQEHRLSGTATAPRAISATSPPENPRLMSMGFFGGAMV